jgi:hypothetical protein
MRKLRRFMPVLLGFSALGLVTLVFGCSGKGFSREGAGSNSSCGAGLPTNSYTPTKVLFMVDTSGSNVQMTTNACAGGFCQDPPSDPNKSFRMGGIMSFFSQFQNANNFSWGLLTFSAGQSYNLTGGQQSIFTNSPSVMANAINSLGQVPDQGDTPYQLAFNTAQQSIAADPQSAQSNYFLILVTDGYPTDFYDGTGNVQTQAVLNSVGGLVNTSPGHVTLSTLYYHNGPSDPTASGLLQQMAQTGRGEFADVNTANTSLYPISQLVPGTNCH